MWSYAQILNIDEFTDEELAVAEITEVTDESVFEDVNQYARLTNLKDFYVVICSFGVDSMRSQILRVHMESRPRPKVLQPQNKNTVVPEEPENVRPRPSEEEVVPEKPTDHQEESHPGISSLLNRSNYNMKYCKESLCAKAQIRKEKLISKLRNKLL